MKNLAAIVLILLVTATLSCTKTNGVNAASIQGKWSIKQDSITSSIGPTSHGTSYVGTATDYFNFSTNGMLYTKEGSELDTFTYTMTSDTVITLGGTGSTTGLIPLHAFMSSFSSSSVTLNIEPTLWNPGGNTTRLTVLTR